MPELPEISIYKKYLDSTSLHKRITKVSLPQTSLLQAPEAEFQTLKGKDFQKTSQLGKYLFLQLEKELWLVFHCGMTGKFEFYQNQETPKYSQIVFTFEDSSHLAFTCRRKLGKIYLTTSVEDFQQNHSLGKDALSITDKEFLEILEAKRGMIKGVLTDQHEISGIGNVYADEILYQCRIHPKTKTEQLQKQEKEALFTKMKEVLTTAIDHHGERAELPASYLSPHRKEGAECPNCSGKIKKIKVSGRSTYFCPSCQKEKS